MERREKLLTDKISKQLVNEKLEAVSGDIKEQSQHFDYVIEHNRKSRCKLKCSETLPYNRYESRGCNVQVGDVK